MIKVYVKKQSSYPISTPDVKKRLKEFFLKNGIVSDAEVSVSFVGEKKMDILSKKYMRDKKIHNVLSFPYMEKGESFQYPPDGMLRLGEIIICFPTLVKEANDEGKIIEEKMNELLEHGAMHLMGHHHE